MVKQKIPPIVGAITPTVRCRGVTSPIQPSPKATTTSKDKSLVAILAPRVEVAALVNRAWSEGEAVLVLDPHAPESVRADLLARLTPTHFIDSTGRRALPDGIPVADEIAAVVVTSGTTAVAKGVELTTAGLESIGAGFAAALTLTETDRSLICLPMHHVAGLAVLARARHANNSVIVHPDFDLDAVARAPEAEGATIVSLVPTMLSRLLDAEAPLHQFRFIITGGAPLSETLRVRAERQRVVVVDAYGLSETWGGLVLNGRPLAGTEFMIAHSDSATVPFELSGTTTGEILVRGAPVMRQYRHDSEATAAALITDFDTGSTWLHTGDVGALTADNRLVIVDRLGDFIISGGVNISPTAVEGALAQHPEVADIAVGGRPDPEWGERVVAYVVPRRADNPPTLNELQAFARRRLAAAHLPRELVLGSAIPRTAGGKIIRRDLARLS